MRRDGHGHAVILVEPQQQRRHLQLVAEVERRGRLVEQQQRGRLRQRRGNHDALLLAAAQLVKRAIGQVRRAGGGQRLARNADVVGPFDGEHAEVRVAAHQHDLDRGVLEGEFGFLRHDRDAPRHVAARQAIERLVAEQDAAGRRPPRAAQQAQQRGLAGAVRAENADERAFGQADADAVDDERAVGRVAKGNLFCGKHCASPPRRLTRLNE